MLCYCETISNLGVLFNYLIKVLKEVDWYVLYCLDRVKFFTYIQVIGYLMDLIFVKDDTYCGLKNLIAWKSGDSGTCTYLQSFFLACCITFSLVLHEICYQSQVTTSLYLVGFLGSTFKRVVLKLYTTDTRFHQAVSGQDFILAVCCWFST